MSELEKISKFFKEIGLEYKIIELIENSFFPEVKIIKGILYFTERVAIADLLHEAGHIAVCPSQIRFTLNNDLVLDEYSENLEYCENLEYANEQAAIAWSFYAVKYLGFNPQCLIDPQMIGDMGAIDEGTIAGLERGLKDRLGSIFSCQLYYGGMIDSKNGAIVRWLQN